MKRFIFLASAILLVMACSLTNGATGGIIAHSVSTSPRTTQRPQSDPPTPTIPTSTPEPIRCIVTAYFLNLRDCGGTNCGVLDVLEHGDILTVLERGDWYKVATDTGAAGYVNSNYCTIGEIGE